MGMGKNVTLVMGSKGWSEVGGGDSLAFLPAAYGGRDQNFFCFFSLATIFSISPTSSSKRFRAAVYGPGLVMSTPVFSRMARG